MKMLQKSAYITYLLLTMALPMSPPAQAHLMVAQHGTLNIVDDGAFMVLSLPISAFRGLDDDSDGAVSMLEFNHHRAAIVESVRQKITLSDNQGNLILEGIMLSPVVPNVVSHDMPGNSISQLTVMGRFNLNDPTTALRFDIGLHGVQSYEQSLEITATREFDKQRHVFEVSPEASASILFPDY